MRINNQDVFGWKNAIIGMRYSFDSENAMDSIFAHDNFRCGSDDIAFTNGCILGKKDLKLMLGLIRGGSPHRKYLRAIHIQLSAKMTMTWWKQYDTYKIATTGLSRSTMHTITKRELKQTDFAPSIVTPALESLIAHINELIVFYNNLKTYPRANPEDMKKLFNEIVDLLPGCYLQERMLDFNYETALNIISQRENHKLSNEWELFSNALLELPYMQTFYLEGIKGKK